MKKDIKHREEEGVSIIKGIKSNSRCGIKG